MNSSKLVLSLVISFDNCQANAALLKITGEFGDFLEESDIWDQAEDFNVEALEFMDRCLDVATAYCTTVPPDHTSVAAVKGACESLRSILSSYYETVDARAIMTGYNAFVHASCVHNQMKSLCLITPFTADIGFKSDKDVANDIEKELGIKVTDGGKLFGYPKTRVTRRDLENLVLTYEANGTLTDANYEAVLAMNPV